MALEAHDFVDPVETPDSTLLSPNAAENHSMTAETLDDRLKHLETSGSEPAAVPVALAATRNPTTVTPPPASQTSADQNGQSSKEKVGENPRRL